MYSDGLAQENIVKDIKLKNFVIRTSQANKRWGNVKEKFLCKILKRLKVDSDIKE